MENPFVYGEVVPGEAFVDREAELDRLVEDLSAGQKVFLISPRRYGKSSLVRQALRAAARRGALTVEVTVSSYSSYVSFLEGYARALGGGGDAVGARAQLADRRSSPRPGPRSATSRRTPGPAASPSRFRWSTANATSIGWPTRCSRCPGGWRPSASARSSWRSTSSRRSTPSTAAASSTRCAPRRSISARSATSSPDRSRA